MVKCKDNLCTHNKAQALLLQRQSPNKGMPHKMHSKNSWFSLHTPTRPLTYLQKAIVLNPKSKCNGKSTFKIEMQHYQVPKLKNVNSKVKWCNTMKLIPPHYTVMPKSDGLQAPNAKVSGQDTDVIAFWGAGWRVE